MDKGISVGNDLGELPSLDKSSSSNSSGGLDKLMKSFNENKLQIVAFLSFFLFIIFTMSLVLGSVDFTGSGGENTYSGNKSLDKLYKEAGGNEALSNARMTSKIDLSTDKYSCSYFVEYEGNNKRNVYCTSCPDTKEEDVTENDEFCRQFVYGDDGDFEYSLLDNEYVSKRRARKENEADIQFAKGKLPECTRTLVDESKLEIQGGMKEQICTLDTSENEGTNLKIVECSPEDIIRIRNMKYENKCDCGNFSNTNQDDCNSNNDNHKCKIEDDSCISDPDDPDVRADAVVPDTTVDSFRWRLFLYLIIPISFILLIISGYYVRGYVKMNRNNSLNTYIKIRSVFFFLFISAFIHHLVWWGIWAHQYQKAQKRKDIEQYKLDWYHWSGILVGLGFGVLTIISLVGDKKPT